MKKIFYIAIFLVLGVSIYIYTGIFIRSYGFRDSIRGIIFSAQNISEEEVRDQILKEGEMRGLILNRNGILISISDDKVMVEVEYFVPGGFSGFKVNQHFSYSDSFKIPGKAITDSVKKNLEKSLERSYRGQDSY